MHLAAALPAVLSGLFYAAGDHEMSFLGAEMCRTGVRSAIIRTMCRRQLDWPRPGTRSSVSLILIYS